MCDVRVNFFTKIILASLLAAIMPAVSVFGDIVSDDFSGSVLNTNVWQFINPLNDASITMTGTNALIYVPGTASHDVWTGANKSARIMQSAADTDFEIEAKFESQVSQKYQMQGFIIEQDSANYLRYDVYFDGSAVRLFAASFAAGLPTTKLNKAIAAGTLYYLRVKRQAGQWSCTYSYDGLEWKNAVVFDRALTVSSLGVFAANHGKLSVIPEFNCLIDYFFNTAAPIIPEDGDPNNNIITVNIVGEGVVIKQPDLNRYPLGSVVELSAVADPDWHFVNWDGDLTGTENPANLTVSGDHTVTAIFAHDEIIDTNAPQITDITVLPQITSAVISWTTDEPASSAVNYGRDAEYEQQQVYDGNLVTEHNVSLTDLSADTVYRYQIISADSSGNQAESEFFTFITDPEPSGAVSDDFSGSVLDANIWQFINPRNDASVTMTGTNALIYVPGTASHNVWTGGNNSARIMQPVSDTDFEIEAKFESQVNRKYQMQGFIIEQDSANYLRYDAYFDGSTVRVFVASFVNGTPTTKLNKAIAAGATYYLLVNRLGDWWTLSYSYDAVYWTVAVAFNRAMKVSSVGVFAGNSGKNVFPEFTCLVDYFFNTAAPIIPEDGDSNKFTVTIDIAGNGTVTKQPDRDKYQPGEVVELTAIPDPNWIFSGWEGAVQGVNNPAVLTVTGNSIVKANFVTESNSVINVWYGNHQVFGGIGIPQRWVNILGDVSNPQNIASLNYSLNGSSQYPLSIGPNNLRLIAEGDFNVEIAYSDLINGLNEVVITATDIFGRKSTQSVTVEYIPGNIWPQNYSIDWNSVSNIQDVAQIVDGKWIIEPNGVRAIQPGYDRLIAIGDVQWGDYEVTVPVLLNQSYHTESSPALGLLFRWSGHYDWGRKDQPRIGWWPMGAIGWFRWFNESNGTYQIIGNEGTKIASDPSPLQLLPGIRYIFKMRVETIAGLGGLYKFKVWQQGQPEPENWLMTAQEQLTDPQYGSILLLAHYADATFGNVTIVPLNQP